MSTRTRIAAAVAAATVLAATTGAAANAMPTEHHATITMTIVNNTDSTMFYDDGFTPGGQWLDAPTSTVPAHSVRTVTVDAADGAAGVGAQLDYHLSGISLAPRGDVTLTANDYPDGTSTTGSRSDGSATLGCDIKRWYPGAAFVYTIGE